MFLQFENFRSNFSRVLSSINQERKQNAEIMLIMHVLWSGKCGKSQNYEKSI